MKKDTPILDSLLQNDFYKFSMWHFIYKHFRDVKASLGFKNRTATVPLGKHLDLGEIREQFDHARTLTFQRDELYWLAGNFEYGELMFPHEFLEFIKNYRLPEYLLEASGDDLRIEFSGLWRDTTQWEIPCLMIINALVNRKRTDHFSPSEKVSLFDESHARLMHKVGMIQNYKYKNKFTFSDFGTRRCFSPEWHDHVVEVFKTRIPAQFRGTSNCYLAKKYGLIPMGTRAHEPEMVMAALCGDDDEKLKQVPFDFCRLWSPGTYGEGLRTHLTDTFGSEYFYKNAPPELAAWGADRQDSGDPFIAGMKSVQWFEKHDQDPRSKKLIPSDGLNVDRMLKLHAHFIDLIVVSPGLGTNATNDMPGIKPLSIVVKPIEANGRSTVKLSNNIAKATGDPKEIERYKRVFEYNEKFNHPCMY